MDSSSTKKGLKSKKPLENKKRHDFKGKSKRKEKPNKTNKTDNQGESSSSSDIPTKKVTFMSKHEKRRNAGVDEEEEQPTIKLKFMDPFMRKLHEHENKLREKSKLAALRRTNPEEYEEYMRTQKESKKRAAKVDVHFDKLAYGEVIDQKTLDKLKLEDLYEDDTEAKEVYVHPDEYAQKDPELLKRFDRDLSVLQDVKIGAQTGRLVIEDPYPENEAVKKCGVFFPLTVQPKDIIDSPHDTYPFKFVTHYFPDIIDKISDYKNADYVCVNKFLSFAEPRCFESIKKRQVTTASHWFYIIEKNSNAEPLYETIFEGRYLLIYTRIRFDVFVVIVLENVGHLTDDMYGMKLRWHSFCFLPGIETEH